MGLFVHQLPHKLQHLGTHKNHNAGNYCRPQGKQLFQPRNVFFDAGYIRFYYRNIALRFP
jgi:hypothetical protein